MRPTVKKPGRRIAAVASLALVATLSSGLAGAMARDLFEDGAFSQYKPDTANGEYLASVAGCMGCHAAGGDDVTNPAGGARMDTHAGVVNVPNITNNANGVSGWTNAQFLNAVINGISPDGRHYLPFFPYTSYAGMKPEDVLDIKGYIESLPGSDNKVPPHEISFPYNTNLFWAAWKKGNFDMPAFQPGDGSQMERGRYLVENVGACNDCHTPRTYTYGLDRANAFKGDVSLTGDPAPAITADVISSAGLKEFSKDFLEGGNKLSGSPITPAIKKHMTMGLSKMTEEDRAAMVAYLTGAEQITAVDTTPPPQAVCEVEDDAAPAVDGGKLAAAADDFIGKYCRNCHGLGQKNQDTFPAGSLKSIAENPAFVVPGNRNASVMFKSITSGRMPPGSKPGNGEIEELGAWIDSLGQEAIVKTVKAEPPARSRQMMEWRTEIQAALNDMGNVADVDKPFIRYFTFRDFYNGYFPCETEEAYKKRTEYFTAGFNKALNSVSLGPVAIKPEPVEGTKDVLMRVDIRDLGWDADKWNQLTAKYPYGYDPSSDATLKALAHDTQTQLPVMRAGWLAANALQPENYHMLLELTGNIRDLEKRIGVDVDRNIRSLKVVRTAFEEGLSGVSDHNRMLERHDAANGGYYWKSYDFAKSKGDGDLKRHPHGPAELEPLDYGLKTFIHDGGEMIFSLPNGLQGYYLSTNTGDRLNAGPTQIVSFRDRPIGKGIEIINGRSCVDCHADGTIAKRDQMRAHIENSTLFSNDAREILLKMYQPQEVLDNYYQKDREAFTATLDKIGAAEKAPDGSLKSKSAPNGGEIITWFADTHEDDLDFERLAAEFGMTPDEFTKESRRIQDPEALALALDWITQFEAGSKIPRYEVELQYAKFVEPLLDLKPLIYKDGEYQAPEKHAPKVEVKVDPVYAPEKTKIIKIVAPAKPVEVPAYKDPDYRDDSYKALIKGEPHKLELGIHVPSTEVYVNDELNFTVTTNKACELQIFYIETDGTVETIPQEMIGDAFIRPGEERRIPDKAVGDLVFDTPGYNETLFAYCHEDGLKNHGITAEEATQMIKESGDKPTRGLAIKMHERKEKIEAKLPSEKKGRFGQTFLTFNVNPR